MTPEQYQRYLQEIATASDRLTLNEIMANIVEEAGYDPQEFIELSPIEQLANFFSMDYDAVCQFVSLLEKSQERHKQIEAIAAN